MGIRPRPDPAGAMVVVKYLYITSSVAVKRCYTRELEFFVLFFLLYIPFVIGR